MRSTAHQRCQTSAQTGKRKQSLKRGARAALATVFFSFFFFLLVFSSKATREQRKDGSGFALMVHCPRCFFCLLFLVLSPSSRPALCNGLWNKGGGWSQGLREALMHCRGGGYRNVRVQRLWWRWRLLHSAEGGPKDSEPGLAVDAWKQGSRGEPRH